jgi:hypothetical protein
MGMGMVMHGDGMAISWYVVAAGVAVLTFSLFSWSFEPNELEAESVSMEGAAD